MHGCVYDDGTRKVSSVPFHDCTFGMILLATYTVLLRRAKPFPSIVTQAPVRTLDGSSDVIRSAFWDTDEDIDELLELRDELELEP